MHCRSLGFATDLAILELGGSFIERRDGYWCVRSPHAPTYYWGNFLLADSLSSDTTVSTWQDRFTSEFQGAQHFALGIDNSTGAGGETQDFIELGYDVAAMTVLTCSADELLNATAQDSHCRQLASGGDWDQALVLGVATRDEAFSEGPFRSFFADYLSMQRSIVHQGQGAWWGSFVNDTLVSQAGVVHCGDSLARFQMVATHPDFRRRGLASQTVATAGKFVAETFGVETLVIVADPNYHAISIYQDLGFIGTEQQLSIERRAETDT